MEKPRQRLMRRLLCQLSYGPVSIRSAEPVGVEPTTCSPVGIRGFAFFKNNTGPATTVAESSRPLVGGAVAPR
jgi:hypothetical protein